MTGVKKPPKPRSRSAPKRHPSGKDDAVARAVGSPGDHDTTSVGNRESAVTAREGTASRREETVGVREETAQVRSELEQRMAQVREANARLVVGAVRAQIMVEKASKPATSRMSSAPQQVVWNLLANAVKFTPEGGRVDVFLEPSNDHMELRVVDTGQGISPDFLPHVFERFRQADAATTPRHTGLGLGLALVRQLVELHGGTVEAASPGVGRGATFTVRLPLLAVAHAGDAGGTAERRIATSTASPMPRVRRLDGLRILVVDDSADGRALTSLLLMQAGASVTAAASVRDALHALAVEPPNVLVSDIGLPDEDGYMLIRHIRQHEAEHGGFLPAVALTGYARAEDRARVLAAGFQAHVTKPVQPVELTAAIAVVTNPLRDREL